MATPSNPLFDAPRISEMPMDDMEPMDTTIDGTRIISNGESALVDFAPSMSGAPPIDVSIHSANLATALSEVERDALASKIIEYVEVDLQSRRDWERRLGQGTELMGLKDVPLENLPFTGASSVTHPLLAEAVVQFQARAVEEIFPSEGPCKTKVIGKRTREREDQAERVREHMNYQMMDEDPSYFWNVDQMLFYLPLGGSAFTKTFFDPILRITVSRFVKSNDFIVPYTATDLVSAPRYTHRMIRTDGEMKQYFASGFYEEVPLLKTPLSAEPDDGARRMEDTADSRTQVTHEDDTINTLYECHLDCEMPFDSKRASYPLPYVVTVLKENNKVIGIRRNWRENDPLMRKRMYFTHYRYLPGFGFYGLGLLHCIGSLTEATSGAVRALLDSAAFANMQGGYASSDAKFKPGEERLSPGVYKQVNMTAEELARAFYTPPFKEPSQALARLYEELLNAGKSFTSTTEAMTGEASNTGPVGTTVALIEQGSKVFSGVHRRIHMAAAEEFKLRAELNYEFLPDNYPYEVEGEDQYVLRSDYDGRVDVIPVSDPNIFSSVQRIAQGQAVVQLATENPDLYDRREAHMRFLKSMRVPDPEGLLPEQSQVKRADPVTENAYSLVGRPFRTYLDQDHDAHIKVHMDFVAGLNEQTLETMGMVMQAHLAEHYAMKYWMEMNRAAQGQLPPLDLHGEGGEDAGEIAPEADAAIAQFAAQQPPIQLMPPDDGSDSAEAAAAAAEELRRQEAFDADQRRAEEEHQLKMARDQEAFEAEQQRQDAKALLVDNREEQSAASKTRREEIMAAAKAKAAAKGKPRGSSKT